MNPELVCALLLLLLGSLPFVGMLRRTWWMGLLLVAFAGSLVWANLRREEVRHEKVEVQASRPIEVHDRGFVSSDACRHCHPGEYASWHASYHRTMTQVASKESVVGDFNNVSLELKGRKYRLSQKDGGYWVHIQSLSDPAKFEPYQIVMTTGSHHMQVYWYSVNTDREIGQLPFVFLFSENRWVPADSTFLRPPNDPLSHENGIWNKNCLNCHATGPQSRLHFAKNSEQHVSTDTHVAEFGIACEACHGPAENHVALNGNALARYQSLLNVRDEQHIVHPDGIQSKVKSQLCGQCHGINFPSSMQNMRNVFWDGFDYRPGDDFFASDSDRILVQNDLKHPMVAESLRRDPRYLRSYFWGDGMVRVSGREFNGLVRSPCFQHEDETKQLQCMSCHQLHPTDLNPSKLKEWADDQLRPGMRGNDACVQCHEEYSEEARVAEHTHHDVKSAGSLCYNCHMPHTTYGLLKGIRSHTVSSPNVAESVFFGRPNACNLCHLDKSLDWTAEHLKSRYDIESPALSKDQQKLSASALWVTQADAGTRGLVAWHLGWDKALDASGDAWQPPLLGVLMTDSYAAVRCVAYHALLKHRGFEDFTFDYTLKPLASTLDDVLRDWKKAGTTQVSAEQLLIDNGEFMRDELFRLLQNRDNRPVMLNE